MSPSPIENLRLKRAYDLISDKLARVEEELLIHFRSPIPTIDRIGAYLAQGGGKRIRPALMLLSARLLDYREGDKDVRYAAVIEFIHTATLVHDDIIDEARLRRGRTSANARWGNNLTVLFGDYLYTMSMGIALDEGDLTILKVLSDTTLSMIEGEILGIEKEGSIHVSREEALEITRRKTADLFSAACRLPAHFAPRGDLVAAERLAEYGRCLGMAFQLIDDLLDYTGSVEQVGKPVLNDLREGKLDDAASPRPAEGRRGRARQGGRGPARARFQDRRALGDPLDRGSLRRHSGDPGAGARLRRRGSRRARRLRGLGSEGRTAPRDRIGHRPHSLSPPGAP